MSPATGSGIRETQAGDCIGVEKVAGINLFDDQLAILTNQAPKFATGGAHAVAASFVLRKFPGDTIDAFPSRAHYDAVRARHPEWRITLFRYDDRLRVLMDDPQSQLVGYFNIGAASQAELETKYTKLLEELGIHILPG